MKLNTIIKSMVITPALLLLAAPLAFAQISAEKAKEIALQHANVKANEVGFVQVKQDFDDGRMEYEIEFWKGNTEYDYTIDANTGAVISQQQEVKQGFVNNTAQAPVQGSVSLEQAKATALQHAKLQENQVRNLSVYNDYDDGRAEIKVKFWKEYTEYEYTIDANSGQVLEFDIENK